MSDLGLFVSVMFGSVWELLKTPVPGFGFSYADIFIGGLFASIALALLSMFFGYGGSDSKGKSTQNPKTSKGRSNDTK